MKATVTKKKVYIHLTDNFAIVYARGKLKINDRVVFWESPLTRLPVPVPIVKK